MNAKPKATRQAFGEMLAELGETHQEIVVLDADLAKSTKSELFGKKYQNRFFEMGIAEANMIGTGSGLALSGLTAFICSFGCFVTGRYDQIRMSIGYADANVKIVGTHAGIGIGDDGHSQMGLEDVSLMRGIPGMSVYQPCDEIEARQIVKHLVENKGPAYLRLTRQALESVHDGKYQFKNGSIDVLSRGKKIAIFASGAAVQEVIKARELLKKDGIDPTIVNIPSLKPLDAKQVLEIASTHTQIFSVEDHYITGGLGSILAEIVATSRDAMGTKLTRLGVQDIPGESGDPLELYEKFGFSSSKIYQAVANQQV
ncbi:MAG: transketolase family protein [Bacteriovoracia bacterium]